MVTRARMGNPSQGSRLASSRPSPGQRPGPKRRGIHIGLVFKSMTCRLVTYGYEVVADSISNHSLHPRNSGGHSNRLIHVKGDEISTRLVNYPLQLTVQSLTFLEVGLLPRLIQQSVEVRIVETGFVPGRGTPEVCI